MNAPVFTALTIEEFGRRLRAGELTAVGATRECLARIAADNPRLNAFILVMPGEAIRQAEEADRELAAGRDRGPLHGVPLSVKDLFDIRSTPTTAASHVRDGHVAALDALAIERVRLAGAVLVGKTNLHEFAFGTTNEDSGYGPARNPHDPSRSPGGSSGGSAASVAAGMALATLGTDTGGSIRIPAAACGIVGLKPGYGETSTEGVVPLSRTLDHVGPLTHSVNDAWLVYCALMGRAFEPLRPAPAERLRLAVPRKYFCDVLDDEVRRSFERAIETLRSAGAVVRDTAIPHADAIVPVYLHIVLSEAAAYHAATLDTMPERYTTPVRQRLEMGRYILAEDYARAMTGREVLRREVNEALEGNDALLLPTLPIPAPPIGAAAVRVGSKDEPIRNLMLRLTQLFNITGHPAISLPIGKTSAGLPLGLQLAGPRTADLLRVARGVEQALGTTT